MLVREDVIILSITRNWLENSNYSQAEFATKMLAPKIEKIEPDETGDYCKWKLAIQQNVSRIMTGKQPFPLKWKWQWVNALPEEYAKECQRQLAAASGYIMPLPSLDGATTINANTHELYKAFSDLVAKSAASHDGVYDERDSIEEANDQVDALLNLVELAQEEVKRIHKGTGATGRVRECMKDNV
ncbi:hypothetical protein [Vibrio harveyi]|uniref:hypothetical protein n=1 Tax=Vibrio harveyi TaxID=669 RepID=UPI0003655E8B|nr:hypothetical protein [Vibrio harveyi]